MPRLQRARISMTHAIITNRLLSPESIAREEAWARQRLGRALLLLGDLTQPLRHHTTLWSFSECTSRRLLGVAALFSGFNRRIATIVADDEVAMQALATRARLNHAALAISEYEATRFPVGVPFSVDAWMKRSCQPHLGRHSAVQPVRDAHELKAFLAEQGMDFWCDSMLRFGHTYGVRNRRGRLVCVGCVNFVLKNPSYAQIGSLVTRTGYRRRGYATQVLWAIADSLSQAGVAEFGLFADTGTPMLVPFYSNRGFERVGTYQFTD